MSYTFYFYSAKKFHISSAIINKRDLIRRLYTNQMNSFYRYSKVKLFHQKVHTHTMLCELFLEDIFRF